MSHPYTDAPDYRMWRRAVASRRQDTDPVVDFPFRIALSDNVMTAGSCFAQYISGRLAESGFGFLVTEKANPFMEEEAEIYNYGRFTARYGNIYTSRQLLQLIRRAYGKFVPVEDIWPGPGGRFIDPFRPQIQPNGFATKEEYWADRKVHFAAIRKAFETLDVFIFTLGLTEMWESTADGAAFPVCPGTAAGEFNSRLHRFRNLTVIEVVEDLTAFLQELRAINPRAKTILTVSPVPLVATAEDTHVLAATTYSKSVLRVAAETIVRREANVAYFPSYEVIMGPQARGRYFESDLRTITEEGVDQVMRLFFSHVTTGDEAALAAARAKVAETAQEAHNRVMEHEQQTQHAMHIMCDEQALDRGEG
jgi:hypothetical protein